MKKFFIIFAVLCALSISAFAANLDGDADASAIALKELNLFHGTDKGFELERPMTRAEAAAMLVRFFGAEAKAIPGKYKHPFTDVPKWADGYVGWLYASGLTNGVAPTLYGSQQPVTAWQYATFITRALKDSNEEIPYGLATGEEITAIDKDKKFIRGDAAIMSVRALSCQYTKNENYRPLADVCIERGLFTAEQFGDACFDFFAKDYTFDDDGYITLRILGLPIRKTESGGYFVFDSIDPIASDGTKYDPFVYSAENDTVIIHTMNPQTLEATEIARRDGISGHYNYRNLFKLGDTHYIFETLADKDKNILLAVNDEGVREVLTFTNGGNTPWYPNPDQNVLIDSDSALIVTDKNYFCVSEDDFFQISKADLKVLEYAEGCIFARRINSDSVDILLLDVKTGKEITSYNIPDDMPRDEYGIGYRDLNLQHENYYYGEAGLYIYNGISINQISSRPVNSFINMGDGSYVILTHPLGNRYSGQTHFGGNQVMQVFPNGEEKLLTRENMDLWPMDGVYLKDGKVHFVTAIGVGMMNFDTYCYRIEDNGKLTVTDFSAGYPEMMEGFSWDNPDAYKEGYIKKEQDRIDALGY